MSETKDKAELLIIANLAEQAERYDGKYGLRFVFPTFSQGTLRQIVGFSGTW